VSDRDKPADDSADAAGGEAPETGVVDPAAEDAVRGADARADSDLLRKDSADGLGDTGGAPDDDEDVDRAERADEDPADEHKDGTTDATMAAAPAAGKRGATSKDPAGTTTGEASKGKGTKGKVKKDKAPPAPKGKQPVKVGGNRWAAPAMLVSAGIGLLWIVVYYTIGNRPDIDLPVFTDLGDWNLVVGMGFIVAAFGFAMKWE